MAESPAEPPFTRIGPEIPASPVVISVPHAGRAYSEALLRASRLPRAKLEALEDRLVDRLVWRAVATGAAALVARAPRAEIDLNRDEREIDAAMVVPPPPARSLLASPRTRGGLGLVPSRISGAGSIWLQRLTEADLAHRIETIHRPYHAALDDMLEQVRRRFGTAILLDCHSMPPRLGETGGAGIVFGDRYGTSMAPDYVRAAVAAAEHAGFASACNAPYAGGYITVRHGRPAENIHALQLEIDRSLYLDDQLRDPGPGFDAAAAMIAAVAEALAARVLEPPQAIAAE
ncbi:MAG TPA: N-formylglutamate amidohydrolase [Allosphingosinicella sp.]|nr:N-formylglutamate amidohydrolase [Allosphingosinicella sp.]